MSTLVKAVLVKFLKGNWGKILPLAFKALAEGQFGEVPKKIYWFLAGKKTIIGALLLAWGTGMEAVCANYPDFAYSCEVATWVYWLGGMLTVVGLADGGTRSPWPEGTPKDQK
jgi:hypothetical protein